MPEFTEASHMFKNKLFITSGVNRRIPPILQLSMWNLICKMPVDKDYLQVFYLSCDKGRQRIKHTQEIPEYSREYIFNTDHPVTAKVFVIDNTIYSEMLLNSEY